LRQALTYAVRYSHVVSTGASLGLIDHGTEVTVTLTSRLRADARALRPMQAPLHAGLASIVILCQETRGGPVDPQSVTFAQADCGCRRQLEAFFNCPVAFGAEHNGIVFRAADLDAPLPTANPVLVRVNEQVLTHYLARLESSELAVRVQSQLMHMLPSGEVHEAAIARSLNLSLRSMQRKLRREGVSFRQLLDETRRRLAEHYLKDSTLMTSEVAYLLGFSEVSSFSRALRRWTGRAADPAAMA
jgi:AraC-like DNA-binding protein